MCKNTWLQWNCNIIKIYYVYQFVYKHIFNKFFFALQMNKYFDGSNHNGKSNRLSILFLLI